jgi:cyclase
MLKIRVIPCLLLANESLVKTIRFCDPRYIGDPINAVRLFNDMEVDELIFLDITATIENRRPNLEMLRKIASECFMPLTYGGGIKSVDEIKEILNIGIEKVAINSHSFENIELISKASGLYGSQCIVSSIDVKRNSSGGHEVYSHSGTKKTNTNPEEWSVKSEKAGAGEILLTSIDKDGTWSGYDIEMIRKVSGKINIPLIANGGAGSLSDFRSAVMDGGASAVAAGSMFVYQKKDCGVLINYPQQNEFYQWLTK